LGVVLIVGLAAVGAWAYDSAGAKTAVVMVAREVAVGQRIERVDLTTVAVAGAVRAIAAVNLDSVVGKTARVQLLPDTLLQRAMVSDAAALPVGAALVGLALKPGQLPAEGLAPGDRVQVLRLPEKSVSGDAGEARVLVPVARVYGSRLDPSNSGGTLLTLLVPVGSVPPVAAAGGAGLVVLAKVGAR
jgi:hypothetical protein